MIGEGTIVKTSSHLALAGALCLAATAFAGCGGGAESAADDQTAARTPERSSTISRDAVEASLVAAGKYFDAGETGKAEAILRELIEKAPDETDPHELLARVLLQRGLEARAAGDVDRSRSLLTDALGQYEEAIARSPDVAGLHQAAGETASMAGLEQRAIEHFQTAGELDRANPKHPLYEAQLLLARGETGAARDAIERSLAIDPTGPFALATLANIRMESGETDAALDTMREAREAAGSPRHERPLRAMEAKLLRQAGRAHEGIRLLATLGEDVRAEEYVAAELAACHVNLDEHAKAAEAWGHRFRATGDVTAAVQAARACLAGGLFQEARRWRRLAELRAPNAPAVLALEDEIESAEQAASRDDAAD